jgi:hypothetical protein
MSKECTLLPLNCLPEKFRTYEKLKATALELDLVEMPRLSHEMTQEILKILVHKLSHVHRAGTAGISVWMSGIHKSYSYIDPFEENQTTEDCISVFELFFLDQTKPMEIYTSELPTQEGWVIEPEDIVYCLFSGTMEE